MTRVCATCKVEKPMKEFYRTSKWARDYRYSCIPCYRDKMKERRAPGSLEKVRARRQRDKTVMSFVAKGYPLPSIAAAVGVTTNTVKNIMQRERG